MSGTVATDGEALQVLVIDEPRAHDVFASEPDRAFADPGTYDAALLHMTDTQYLAQRAPELFTGMTRWTADNAADRKIDYVMHTGDLIQSWIRLNGTDDAARREFALAHDAMSTLTNAGVPFGVLPGNHDNKWNVAGRLVPGMHDENNALFNEYFGPHEFDSRPWWGGSVAPDDNFAHFDLVELADAEFLMLSIGFNPPEHVLRWAEDVLDRYPDRNVVIGAHYYLDDDGRLRMSGFGDTGSAGQQIWNRLVVPYESVVMVLSGHVDGQTTVTDRPIPGTDRRVVEMLADYQGFLVDGERRADFQRLLQFDLDGGRVAVDTHSPALDSFAVEDYDPQRRYGADDGEFVAPVQLRGDLPRAVMAGS
ncbi:metallophosphoesterase [Rhodococcus sp. HNM0569]|uniref:metallophosphoesterase n=1 Tax=Rhodococcus sp. HNM0569 TaxID=2716340 RepID=UPI003211D712